MLAKDEWILMSLATWQVSRSGFYRWINFGRSILQTEKHVAWGILALSWCWNERLLIPTTLMMSQLSVGCQVVNPLSMESFVKRIGANYVELKLHASDMYLSTPDFSFNQSSCRRMEVSGKSQNGKSNSWVRHPQKHSASNRSSRRYVITRRKGRRQDKMGVAKNDRAAGQRGEGFIWAQKGVR
jgi:hypothetical protein